MLFLEKIIITHFKNYEISQFAFNEKVTGICGRNGIGKTNLLDAIYYSCFTKSYFTSSDNLNIGFAKDGFRIESHFFKNSALQKVVCMLKPGSKKEFLVNDVVYEKLSQHIGLLPCVMIAPDDIEIINGGSEGRRRFLDTVLCQLDTDYLLSLIQYNKILQQRNGFLKNAAGLSSPDYALLDILDMQLCAQADFIYHARKTFCSNLIPLIHQLYNEIAASNERVTVHYDSRLNDKDMKTLLKENRSKDLMMQRTLYGIHKDDLMVSMDQQLFKNIASQGQKKSMLFAMKLSEYEMIRISKGFSPVILLDDVFEKLDDQRMNNLLRKVCTENEGQVFITDTHRQRLEQMFSQIGVKGQIIEL